MAPGWCRNSQLVQGRPAASSCSVSGLMSISSCRSCGRGLWTEQVCSLPGAACPVSLCVGTQLVAHSLTPDFGSMALGAFSGGAGVRWAPRSCVRTPTGRGSHGRAREQCSDPTAFAVLRKATPERLSQLSKSDS